MDDKYTVTVEGAKGLSGTIIVPGDKSISHRAVILGSIADGTTVVEGFGEGADNLATMDAMRQMGVRIDGPDDGVLTIHGVGMQGLKAPGEVIDCRNSGTTARLLTGLLSAQEFSSTLTGDASLKKRPMKRVVEPLRKMRARITGEAGGDRLPLQISGSTLKGIEYESPVASAQVKSALLLAGLYATGETVVEEPERSRDHTERLLKFFGADVSVEMRRTSVTRTEALKAARVSVPGDLSSAAFFMVGAAITPASELVIKDVGVNLTRSGIITILLRMGASIETRNKKLLSGEPAADLVIRSSRLKGIKITGSKLLPAIDEFPVICVAAAFAEGTTTVEGAGELRLKESDRISAMASALTSLGVEASETKDGIVIKGTGGGPIAGGSVNPRADHRIAMSAAVAGLKSVRGVTVEDAGCADISFPGFFELLQSAAGKDGAKPPKGGVKPPADKPKAKPPAGGLKPPAAEFEIGPPEGVLRPPADKPKAKPPAGGLKPPAAEFEIGPPDGVLRPPEGDLRPPEGVLRPPADKPKAKPPEAKPKAKPPAGGLKSPAAVKSRGPIIAIDGPSGVGKTTVSKLLSRKLNYSYIDTGAMYRAVALGASRAGVDLESDQGLQEYLKGVDIRFNEDGAIFLNGTDVNFDIRKPGVGGIASVVSSRKPVREFLASLQRRIGASGNVVMEGRDIGTVIFPDAEVKIFLDASKKVRVGRRHGELSLDTSESPPKLKDVAREIEDRDTRDTTRVHSPLVMAVDAECVDTGSLDVEEVVEKILKIVKDKLGDGA